MVNIVTASENRSISGAPVNLLDDSAINSIITLVQAKTETLFGIKLTPTKKIEILEGEFKRRILVDEYFPLTAYKVINGETEMDLGNVFVKEEEGFFEFYGDTISGGYGFPFSTTRFSGYDLDVKLKYLYGAMERDTTVSTDTTAVASSGTSVEIEVLNSDDFTVGEWAYIEDINRAKEVFKITNKEDSTHITAERLVNDYQTDAIVTRAKTYEIFKQFVLYESAIAVAVNAVGATYTIATGYTYPEYSVQKGVPWTHWQNNYQDNVKQRDALMPRIKSLLGSLV